MCIRDSDTASRIAEMMNYNVQTAYGGEWTFPGLNVSAKTGTAEVGDGTSDVYKRQVWIRDARDRV